MCVSPLRRSLGTFLLHRGHPARGPHTLPTRPCAVPVSSLPAAPASSWSCCRGRGAGGGAGSAGADASTTRRRRCRMDSSCLSLPFRLLCRPLGLLLALLMAP